jgi:hypothetical protein
MAPASEYDFREDSPEGFGIILLTLGKYARFLRLENECVRGYRITKELSSLVIASHSSTVRSFSLNG